MLTPKLAERTKQGKGFFFVPWQSQTECLGSGFNIHRGAFQDAFQDILNVSVGLDHRVISPYGDLIPHIW